MKLNLLISLLATLHLSCLEGEEAIFAYEYDQRGGCRGQEPYKIGDARVSSDEVETVGYCYTSSDKRYITYGLKEGWPKSLDDYFKPCSAEENLHFESFCKKHTAIKQ
jgi:hypothetical protein